MKNNAALEARQNRDVVRGAESTMHILTFAWVRTRTPSFLHAPRQILWQRGYTPALLPTMDHTVILFVTVKQSPLENTYQVQCMHLV